MSNPQGIPPIRWIKDGAALIEACDEWQQLDAIGIDTEFVRTRTFHARLGLIQVASGRDYCALIDPLALNDLDALGQLFGENGPTKILHSGSEDLEIFVRLWGYSPWPMFDTQIAAALCGLGPSLSYSALVESLLGIELSKSETRSDWTRRPLTDAQVGYAAMDAIYLNELRDQLQQRLDQLGRLEWFQEDMQRARRKAEANDAVNDQFGRFNLAWKLDPVGIELLWLLVDWRETMADKLDRPRNHVLDANVLMDIAHQQPTSAEDLKGQTRISPKAASRYGDDICRLVERAARVEPDQRRPRPPQPLDASTRQLMKQLKGMVREAADRLGLAPELIAGKRELVALLQSGQLPEKLQGWRRAVIGDELLQAVASESH
jgi:ribonuclease D